MPSNKYKNKTGTKPKYVYQLEAFSSISYIYIYIYTNIHTHIYIYTHFLQLYDASLRIANYSLVFLFCILGLLRGKRQQSSQKYREKMYGKG